MPEDFYNSPEWRALAERVKQRDGNRCTVSRLIGGECSALLHVHHIVPRRERLDLELEEDNCGTVCAIHHPVWESVWAWLRKVREPLPPCRHKHPYRSGRIQCENERRRKAGLPLIEDDQRVLIEA